MATVNAPLPPAATPALSCVASVDVSAWPAAALASPLWASTAAAGVDVAATAMLAVARDALVAAGDALAAAGDGLVTAGDGLTAAGAAPVVADGVALACGTAVALGLAEAAARDCGVLLAAGLACVATLVGEDCTLAATVLTLVATLVLEACVGAAVARTFVLAPVGDDFATTFVATDFATEVDSDFALALVCTRAVDVVLELDCVDFVADEDEDEDEAVVGTAFGVDADAFSSCGALSVAALAAGCLVASEASPGDADRTPGSANGPNCSTNEMTATTAREVQRLVRIFQLCPMVTCVAPFWETI